MLLKSFVSEDVKLSKLFDSEVFDSVGSSCWLKISSHELVCS